ncbi:hypothetical protein JGUZn3_00240 [Entomobacter blattae]|uniref:Ankyrin repeat domain-containing protein n=1 Tax=Entomobacter blattae TaxID=2762277 RepID=A0A7H1NND1_9PROT|nr:hypothetical protein JGUZn3_00240 [Entomobacter blattae]
MQYGIQTKRHIVYGFSLFCLFLPSIALAQAPGQMPSHADSPNNASKKDFSEQDTDPTTSLFDAINKGNANAAKEALNRGADINARNILDQTPMDMAIDLNRFDIAFLFLALRTYGGEGDNSRITTANLSEPGNAHASSSRRSSHKKTMIQTTVGSGESKAHHSASGPYSPNDGHAQPNVGFLGFGN